MAETIGITSADWSAITVTRFGLKTTPTKNYIINLIISRDIVFFEDIITLNKPVYIPYFLE